jgi:hypothetical protein
MNRTSEVPPAYRRYFFVNAGGPLRRTVRWEVVDKHWQLVTLDCGHEVLVPHYRRAGRLGCGFCGGFLPSAEQ